MNDLDDAARTIAGGDGGRLPEHGVHGRGAVGGEEAEGRADGRGAGVGGRGLGTIGCEALSPSRGGLGRADAPPRGQRAPAQREGGGPGAGDGGEETEAPKAPGMKYRHYAPRAPVTVVTGDGAATAAYIRRQAGANTGVICFGEYRDRFPGCTVRSIGPAGDRGEQARRVFDALRSFDGTSVTAIFAQCPGEEGLGLAVANRLKKAAGFQIVAAEEGEP